MEGSSPQPPGEVPASVRARFAWAFVCECGRAGCEERVRLTLEDYELLLEEQRPILAPGHEQTQAALAQRLREEARALRAQAEHQLARARRNVSRAEADCGVCGGRIRVGETPTRCPVCGAANWLH